MAEGTSSSQSTEAKAAPPPRRGGSGFFGGVIGGALAAGGAVVALQYPEVREQIPLPEEASLIIEPEQVRRINALEELSDTLASKNQLQAFESELRAVRAAVGAAEESATLESLTERLDLLSADVSAAATAEQLDTLRVEVETGLNAAVATSEETATAARQAEITLNAVLADVLALKEAGSVRDQQLADVGETLTNMQTGLEAISVLEAATAELGADLAALAEELDGLGGELDDVADELLDRVAEQSAALTGRIDATARDAGELRTTQGAALAEIAALGAQLEGFAGDMGTRIDGLVADLGTRIDEVRGNVNALNTQLTAVADQQRQNITTMTSNRRAGIQAFEDVNQSIEKTRTDLAKAISDAKAELADLTAQASTAAERANAAADAAQASVDQALARATAGGVISAAAAAIGASLDTGGSLESPLSDLAALDESGMSEAEVAALSAATDALAAHGGGVSTAAGLQQQFADLRGAAAAASGGAPAESGTGDRILRSILKPTTTDADVVAALDDIEADLAAGDLASAVTKSDALPEPVKATLAPWLEAVSERLAATAAQRELVTIGRALSASAVGASRS